MEQLLDLYIKGRADLFLKLYRDEEFKNQIFNVLNLIKLSFGNKNKILIFGNGGSAAEAQHFAAELVCQFEKRRRSLPAIALTTDSSILSAQGNDFGFETIFSRQIEALANEEDLVIGFTTSDAQPENPHSLNILKGFEAAKNSKAKTVGFFSQKTTNLLGLVDSYIKVPSSNTAIIQEGHLFAIHVLCALIEREL